MSFSEVPPPPELNPGNDRPFMRTRPSGPSSRSWLKRFEHWAAPMGLSPARTGARAAARQPNGSIVYSTGKGSNVLDVDGNRYVDLAAGFGSLLIGHGHPYVLRVIELQASRLLQALGDVFPSESKIALLARLAALLPSPDAQVILGQSGADAVSAALKTALLFTARPKVVAFHNAYHGLSYAPLSACGFRPSYREPFQAQLGSHVRFVDYPNSESAIVGCLDQVAHALRDGDVGCCLLEPISGRAGCFVPPDALFGPLHALLEKHGVLLIADEIWTGLGRAGSWLYSVARGLTPDLICLGKGLGGGLPISACIGRRDVMQAWRREPEVVHTSTFAGSPLACATAIATLDVLSREGLIERSEAAGERWRKKLARVLPENLVVRGRGLMVGIDCQRAGRGGELAAALLEQGYITSTGGRDRDALVLTPPLTIDEALLEDFVACLLTTLQARPEWTS
jgi:4-aminobutyrate aminotransferase/(S)-3-amino-2-methylpropionate transaminase